MERKDSKALMKALTDQVAKALAGKVPKAGLAMAKNYAAQCFRRVPVEDLQAEDPNDLAAMIADQMAFLRVRKPADRLVRVFNPTLEENGWECRYTVIELVNQDSPFLVDTASMIVSELGLNVHLIIHPVMRLERDKSGVLEAVLDKNSDLGQRESIMQFRVDRRNDAADLELIRSRMAEAMEDVSHAVADWRAMERRAAQSELDLPTLASKLPEDVIAESREFMRWLMDDHFIFLGVRDYTVEKGDGRYELRLVQGSGLGILREDEDTETVRPLTSLAAEARRRNQKIPILITKTNARSTVHRAGYLDYIGVLQFDRNGRTIGERRFLGLFTSVAYNLNAMDTPIVRMRCRKVLEESGLRPGSHAWKSMVHILESLPRDELMQAQSTELRDIAVGVLNLQERQRVRVFIRRERYGRFYSCLVYLPRERFNTENREKIQHILKRALKGDRLDYAVHVAESRLARLYVVVRPRKGSHVKYDESAIEEKIIEAVRSWTDGLRAVLLQKHGDERGLELTQRFGMAFPEAYKEDISPWVAAFDVDNLAAVDGGEELRMSLYRPRKSRGGIIRFKIFRAERPVPLSEVLPMLENLGLVIVNERPYELILDDGKALWVQDFDMIPGVDRELDLDIIRDLFTAAFLKIHRREVDSDGFNRLIIAAQMNWRQVMILRAYTKYLMQTGIPFSKSYMAETLSRYPIVARLLVELFQAMFEPRRDNESDYHRELAAKKLLKRFHVIVTGAMKEDRVLLDFMEDASAARYKDRDLQVRTLEKAFLRCLNSVTSLDDDRILHAYYNVMKATLRTNFFQRDAAGERKEYTSFKLDSGALPDLPLPRPYREIWVYSPRFEGIHLRCGAIARGGLRWSDRREDFRTEVLGLMKAQNVKNTMIVPVGAKGGFVPKHLPSEGGRDAVMEEVVRCYKGFINGLLDITDNLDEEDILHPERVIRRDADDPYLVVAADKGTATFSDTANGVAAEHDFWLGDAFASGGSVGYDHKGMGITARGAWEGVKRHFREMGLNTQKEPFIVVGIGDMSGDVFGNGMLLSRHIKLRAAFNHLHIFLDPDPDEKASFQERRRLFRKPRSGWTDYNPELISAGGGVFSRSEKTIPLSKQVRDWLGVEETQLTPNALIRALLRAEVDLLWNGGIGTYVKASTETHADVGDLSNNALRVDGRDLGCKVVGEGGNLGLTQLGRIEFALNGGRVNTDFIDNSAGVDTSDHEVNIKILLNQVMRAGKLDVEARNQLLADMTDEVASLVLRSNYLQTQTLTMMENLSVPRLGSKQHFIHVLEDEGLLDRELEFLPDDETFAERLTRGEGMTRPELSVLLSYSKISLYQQLLQTDIPEDSYLSDELALYFPEPLRGPYSDFMKDHRLRREIIATQVTNSVVNRMGASFILRMCEDSGAEPADVARAYTIVKEVFNARDYWWKVEALDNKVSSELQTAALLEMWNLIRQGTRWLLNLSQGKLDIQSMIDRLKPGLDELQGLAGKGMSAEEKARFEQRLQPYVEGGFSKVLARRTALLPRLFPLLDVVETAARRQTGVERVAEVFFGLGDALSLKWLREQVESLEVSGRWHALSRANLRDDLFTQHTHLVENVLKSSPRAAQPLQRWMDANADAVQGITEMLTHMKSNESADYAVISVAVKALQQLAKETQPE